MYSRLCSLPYTSMYTRACIPGALTHFHASIMDTHGIHNTTPMYHPQRPSSAVHHHRQHQPTHIESYRHHHFARPPHEHVRVTHAHTCTHSPTTARTVPHVLCRMPIDRPPKHVVLCCACVLRALSPASSIREPRTTAARGHHGV